MAKKGYGQFCPLAKAAEIVAERWTPLVLRELYSGSHRFNELRRGLPLMSPSLLSQRLRELEGGGLVEKKKAVSGPGYEYHLTEAAEELRPVIESLGVWGARWVQKEVKKQDLDPGLLMWDVRRRVDTSVVPPGETVTVEFDLSGVPARKGRYWLIFQDGEADLCLKDPGHEVDLIVSSPIRVITEIWTGHRDLDRALKSGELDLDGPRKHVRLFPKWFVRGVFADVVSA